MDLDKYSKKYIHYHSCEFSPMIKSMLNKHNMKTIVDLGSGDGSILYALFKKGYLNNIEKVIAVDISQDRINNVKRISDKILGIVADVCKLDMLDNMSVDLVISNQVIEHLPDEDRFIKEVYRVLSKQGLFYLSTVFKKWYGWYFYRCNGRWVLDPTHLREYTQKCQLLDLLEKNNFQVIESEIHLQWFAITDFILKRLGFGALVYCNPIANFLRKIKIPILGYYNWELILKKK